LTLQTIVTPAGEKLIVLTEAEFLLLRDAAEMSADVAAYDRAMQQLASGEDELVPSEIVDRLLGGQNPVLVWREHRGLSREALSAAAGIGPDELSRIEADIGEANVAALRKLAPALSLAIDDLV